MKRHLTKDIKIINKHMKKCSSLLLIGKIEMKTSYTVVWYLTEAAKNTVRQPELLPSG